MQIISSAFKNNEVIPVKYTCKGANINPPLEFKNLPPGTSSLLLTVTDVDSLPSPWAHWFLFNIPAHVTSLKEGTLPPDVTEGLANGGTFGYEGPCPIYFKGTHHYRFSLFALNKKLDYPKNISFYAIEEKIKEFIIEQAELRGIAEGTGEKLNG